MFGSNQEERTTHRERIHFQMVGVCLENVVGPGMGPELKYAECGDLKRVKLSHDEVVAAIESLERIPEVLESFVWNTCNRFEVYFFHLGDRRETAAKIEARFFSALSQSPEKVNRIEDEAAVHHLVRTVVGFNSGLPGEEDVSMQLASAVRLSKQAGGAGELTDRLVEEVFQAAEEIRGETAWGRFSPSYCGAAIEEALHDVCLGRIQSGRVVGIGSSNTTRSSIEILRRRFGISAENLTVYHRCHHKDGQMKSMRRSSRGSDHVRVADYDDEAVHRGIARARLAVIGIDRQQPVISGEKLAKHLKPGMETIVIDFNTFGSTEGLKGLPGVRLVDAAEIEEKVRRYAVRMASEPAFQAALAESEPIARRWARAIHRGEQPVFETAEETPVRQAVYALGAA